MTNGQKTDKWAKNGQMGVKRTNGRKTDKWTKNGQMAHKIVRRRKVTPRNRRPEPRFKNMRQQVNRSVIFIGQANSTFKASMPSLHLAHSSREIELPLFWLRKKNVICERAKPAI